jgi:predicted DNA-binding transcriptional regulator AlpA
MQITNHPDLINVFQAMKILGYKNRCSFCRARKRMDFRAYRLNGRKVMFDKREIYAWLESTAEGRRPPI